VAYYVAKELARPAFHYSELVTHKVESRPPLQLLAFYLVSQAFKDARGTNRIEAASAIRWLRLRSDYSRVVRATGRPIPADIRTEYTCQFEWCCVCLEWDPDQVRYSGMPIPDVGSARLRGWSHQGGLKDWRRWRTERKEAQAQRVTGLERQLERRAARQLTESTIVITSNEEVSAV
jgi:hypothetical protein